MYIKQWKETSTCRIHIKICYSILCSYHTPTEENLEKNVSLSSSYNTTLLWIRKPIENILYKSNCSKYLSNIIVLL